MTISNFDIQRMLAAAGYYKGDIDGDIGPKSLAGINLILEGRQVDLPKGFEKWSTKRKSVAALQLILKYAGYPEVGAIDGYAGMMTEYAYGQYEFFRLHGHHSDKDWRPDEEREKQPTFDLDPVENNHWPLQRDMAKRFGPAGGAQCTRGKVELPFEMRIAWNKTQKIKVFSCHEDVADSATRVYARIASAYSPEDIRKHGFDLFGGCYNYRVKRGGSTLSTHAYGIAIDHDPERNQLKWGRDRAHLAHPDCVEFFRCWEAEGWLSLGRHSNFDWMHVQAARL